MAGLRAWCDNPNCIHRGHEIVDGSTSVVVVDRDDLRVALLPEPRSPKTYDEWKNARRRLRKALA